MINKTNRGSQYRRFESAKDQFLDESKFYKMENTEEICKKRELFNPQEILKEGKLKSK